MRAALTGLAALIGLTLGLAAGPDALAAPPDKPARAGPARKPRKPADDKAAAPKEPTREERVERARLLFVAADEKFAAGDFAGALAGFRAVNDVARSPLALFRIALCLEKVGTRAEAEDAFHRFLGLPPPEALAEQKRIADERLAALAAGTLRITSFPGSATVAIDGKPAVGTPVEVRLPPGKHVVVAAAPEYEPATSVIDVPRGLATDLAVALAPLPPPSPPLAPAPAPAERLPATPAGATQLTPAIAAATAFGLAAVGLGVGTAFGVRALGARSDYGRAPSADLADKATSSAVVADGAIGAALVFATVGTVFLIQRRASAPPAAWRIAPFVSPRAQGAAAVLHF